MKYKVLFDIQYLNGSSRFEEVKFETKGKGKKVLRAHLQKYIKNTLIYENESHPVNIVIVSINRVEELNPNNIWDKEDREKFINKYSF